METLKIQAPKWKIYLTVLALVVFVVLGIWMLIGDTSWFHKIVGLISIVFFGGFGSVAMYSTLVKGKGYVVITPEALELSFPDCPIIPIKWEWIKGFGIYEISGQSFTTVKLQDYQDFMQEFTPSEIQKILNRFKALKVIGHATAAIKTLGPVPAGEIAAILPTSEDLKKFSSFLTYSRNKFGGEFQIAWNMRDRKAVEFAEFLEEKRQAYTTL
ncbi:MAG: hypothetical protein HRU41_37345 [Saprospiraceae bacterium]|nr:hypothetical protein [Saprospiraceae bacterium]